MNGVPDFAIYRPGASSSENDSRRQPVRAVVVHTTQGPDSRGVGETRTHSSPGTFNFLVRDEGVYCFYPADVRCSHAAGANHAGPGIENEGYTGQPLTANQIVHLGQLAHWLADTYGVPLRYATGDPRLWLDNTADSGFFAHRKVAYPPDLSLQHFDEITPDEWARAIGAPAKKGNRDMWILHALDGPFAGQYRIVTANGIGRQTSPLEAAAHKYAGVTVLDMKQVGGYEALPVDQNVVLAAIRALVGWLAKAMPAAWRTRGGSPPAV